MKRRCYHHKWLNEAGTISCWAKKILNPVFWYRWFLEAFNLLRIGMTTFFVDVIYGHFDTLASRNQTSWLLFSIQPSGLTQKNTGRCSRCSLIDKRHTMKWPKHFRANWTYLIIWSITSLNVEGAFIKPNEITSSLKVPKLHTITVFHFHYSLIPICQLLANIPRVAKIVKDFFYFW